jgi:hypothetical protein
MHNNLLRACRIPSGRFAANDGQTESSSGPEVVFEEIIRGSSAKGSG